MGWLRRLCVGWGWVVIIKLKANLSSTSHLTSQLDLSLATKEWQRDQETEKGVQGVQGTLRKSRKALSVIVAPAINP